MKDLPFSIYDFFAYLSSGFVVLVVVDLSLGEHWVLRDDQSLILSVGFILAAYIVGHTIAQLSSTLIEKMLVGKVIGKPHSKLLNPSGPISKFFFPGYSTPLPEKTIQRIKTKNSELGFEGSGEELFLHVFGTLKAVPTLKERLSTFLNLYGFARNVSLALFISGIIILIANISADSSLISSEWSWLLFFLSGVMFYRYLKFFKQYTFELLVTYSEFLLPERK